MSEMYGVIKCAYFNNLQRTAELNNRISERNIPSKPLQPHFGVRPVSTKYDMMSVVDRRAKSNVPITKQPIHSVSNNFNPGSAQAPWEGFARNINDESRLRNQFFALQRCENASFIPSSTSDMYEVNVGGRVEAQTHPKLFETDDLGYFNPNPNTNVVGHNIFHNSTRNQIKNI